MSACAKLSFNSVTPQVWSCVSQKAIQAGGPNPFPPSGTFSTQGFTFQWSYDANSQTAWVQCTDSPWYVLCSLINSTLEGQIGACFNAAGVAHQAFELA